jgi:serine/threonine protein kinase
MYGARTRVIAECDCDKTAKGEIQALERLRGSRGIVPFLGSSERARNKRYSIFLEYFSCGSLSHMLRAKKQFTIPQAIKIAQDLAMGLRNMHAKKMVHRDLHWGNVLLRPTKNGLYDAVLVDFGKTANYKEIRDEIPQGAKSRHPPEALLVPFKKLERFSIDIYALGCTLYQVVWGKLHPWALTYNAYDVDKYGKRECIRKYQGIVSSYRSTKSTCLASANKKLANGQKLSPGDKFKILIFDMMHFNPKNRPNLQTIISRLEKISASEVQ